MTKDKRRPSIRFPGFEDDWEQRKLGEISESYSGGTPSVGKAEYYGGEIPFIRSAEINDSETELYITDEGLANSSAKLVKKGDILYALYGATSGEVGVSKIDGAINQAILAIIPKEGYDSWFIMQWLRSNKENIINKYLQGGQGNLSGTIVKELEMLYPNLEEQNEIGNFFKKIDEALTLHQQKLDDLKNLKSGLLQKMFPQKGEKVPQVRFPGFTGDWEQRKLSDIAERVTRKNTDLETTLPLTISAQYGLVDQETFFNKRVASSDISGYFLIRSGEFAYNKSTSNASPYGAIKRLDLYDKGALSTLYIVFKLNEDISPASDFYTSYFDGNQWHKEIIEIATEGARNHGLLNVSPVDFMNIEMNIPPTMEEQIQIGAFFKKVDETITLHQQKIDDLNQLKSGLLQKMFP